MPTNAQKTSGGRARTPVFGGTHNGLRLAASLSSGVKNVVELSLYCIPTGNAQNITEVFGESAALF